MFGYFIGYSEFDNVLSINQGKFFVVVMQGVYENVGSDILLLKMIVKVKYIVMFNNIYWLFLCVEVGVIEIEDFDCVLLSL